MSPTLGRWRARRIGGQSAAALIGRRAELSWLRDRVDLALGGFPHLVVVEGESGIGKTRLAHEALEHARRRQGDGAARPLLRPPRPPVPAAARLVVRRHRRRPRATGRPRRRASSCSGGCGRRRASSPRPTTHPEVIERERTRQLLALTELVLDYASTTPSVVFVDDVDWADAATVDLLRHLMFRLDDVSVPLLVLVDVTRRPDRARRGGSGPPAHRAAHRGRAPALADRGSRPPSSPASCSPTVPIDRARDLATASGGNPLLVEALVRDRRSSPGAVRHRPRAPGARGGGRDHRRPVRPPPAAPCSPPWCSGPTRRRTCVATISDADERRGRRGDRRRRARRGRHHARVQSPDLRAHRVRDGDDVRRAAPCTPAPRPSCRRSAPIAHHLVAGDAVTDDDGARERALCRQRRPGPRRVGGGRPLLRGRAHPPASAGRAGRAAPAGRPEPAGQPAAGPGGRPLRDRAAAARARRRRRHPGRAAPLAHPLRHRHPGDAGGGRRPRSARSAGRRGRGRRPRARGRGAGRAVAVVLGRVAHEAGDAVRAPRDGDRRRARRPLRLRARHHRAERAAVGALRPARFAGVAGGRRRPRARRGTTTSLLAGGPVFRVPLVLTWLGRVDEAETRALECSDIAERVQYPLELGLPLAALTQIAVARGEFDQAEQYAHRALLLQRLSGYHWAAGLFLPPLACAHVARGQYEQARDALATWSETADELEQASVDLFSRWVDALRASPRGAGRAAPRAAARPAGRRRRVGGAGGRARAARGRDR